MDKLIIVGMIVGTILSIINLGMFLKTRDAEFVAYACFNALAVIVLAVSLII